MIAWMISDLPMKNKDEVMLSMSGSKRFQAIPHTTTTLLLVNPPSLTSQSCMVTFHAACVTSAGLVLMLGMVSNKNVTAATIGNTRIVWNLSAKIKVELLETSPTTHRGVGDACNLVTAASLIAEVADFVIDVKYIFFFAQYMYSY